MTHLVTVEYRPADAIADLHDILLLCWHPGKHFRARQKVQARAWSVMRRNRRPSSLSYSYFATPQTSAAALTIGISSVSMWKLVSTPCKRCGGSLQSHAGVDVLARAEGLAGCLADRRRG